MIFSMKSLLIILFVIVSLPLLAQIEDGPSFNPMEIDHLEPISSYGWVGFDSEIITDSDFLNKDDFVISQHYQHSHCESNFMISLLGSNSNRASFKIAYTFATKPLNKARKRHIKTIHRAVSLETSSLIQNMYELVLINTRYSPNADNVWLLDCANTHHFHGHGPKYRPMYGGTVSPRSGTPPDWLIQASNHMIAFVKEEIDEIKLAYLINQAKKSIGRYNK